MPNEFIIKNGFHSQGNSEITGSLNVTGGVTGSFSGNGAGLTGVAAFPFTGSALITGSLGVTGSTSFMTTGSGVVSPFTFTAGGTATSPNVKVITSDGVSEALLIATRLAGSAVISTAINRGFLYLGNAAGYHNVISSNDGLAFSAYTPAGYDPATDQMRLKNGNLGIGTGYSATARLDIKAPGALSTDIAFRVRNSADTVNLASIQGDGVLNLAYLADTSRIAINSTTSGQSAIAIGSGNSGLRTVSVGYNNDASGQNGVVIGQGNTAASAGNCGIIVGYNNNHISGIVVGKSNTGQLSLIFGNSNSIGGSGATNNNVIAIGNGMTETSGNAKLPHTFMFGSYATTGNKAGLSFRSNNINHLLLGYDIMDSSYSNTSGSNWMGFKSGSLPVQSPNTFKIWASGSVGNVKPYFITENGTTIWLGDESRLFNVTASSITSSFTGSLTGSVTNYETAWTSYTPAWTTDGVTQPVIGNGSVTGAYKQIGKTVFVRVKLNCGSTTTFGTGAWQFGLPVTASNADGIQFPCSILENSVAWFGGTVNGTYSGATFKSAIITPQPFTHTQAAVTATSPFTWGDTDSLQFNGTYESI